MKNSLYLFIYLFIYLLSYNNTFAMSSTITIKTKDIENVELKPTITLHTEFNIDTSSITPNSFGDDSKPVLLKTMKQLKDGLFYP